MLEISCFRCQTKLKIKDVLPGIPIASCESGQHNENYIAVMEVQVENHECDPPKPMSQEGLTAEQQDQLDSGAYI